MGSHRYESLIEYSGLNIEKRISPPLLSSIIQSLPSLIAKLLGLG